jgi:hypothetical protein
MGGKRNIHVEHETAHKVFIYLCLTIDLSEDEELDNR